MNVAELSNTVFEKLADTAHPFDSKAQCNDAVKAVFATVFEELEKGGEVRYPGFGTFSTYEMKARKGRNVATGEPIDIPAHRVPKFAAGSKLKAAVAE